MLHSWQAFTLLLCLAVSDACQSTGRGREYCYLTRHDKDVTIRTCWCPLSTCVETGDELNGECHRTELGTTLLASTYAVGAVFVAVVACFCCWKCRAKCAAKAEGVWRSHKAPPTPVDVETRRPLPAGVALQHDPLVLEAEVVPARVDTGRGSLPPGAAAGEAAMGRPVLFLPLPARAALHHTAYYVCELPMSSRPAFSTEPFA
ncbi:hypothetical protein DIPPA_06753 [Diplonema papillatum]|nr:hypothetical protein DIPPA_06753 [Diplonema papillatum]